MQIARPHTRFFRLVYDSPKQSDILCGINIRIHIVSAISAVFVAYGLLWAYTKYWPRSSK